MTYNNLNPHMYQSDSIPLDAFALTAILYNCFHFLKKLLIYRLSRRTHPGPRRIHIASYGIMQIPSSTPQNETLSFVHSRLVFKYTKF